MVRELLRRVVECGRKPLGEADALPFAAYVDPELFALERELVFAGDWIAICAEASLLRPGDYCALELAGEPIVVFRAKDGELRALSNACRHRGTPIADSGFGSGLQLVCPYHAWAYDEAGGLRGAPYPGSVTLDPEHHRLAAFAVDVWRGVVFVHLGSAPKPLAERLAGIDTHLSGYDLDRFDTVLSRQDGELWHANWKAVLENGFESYHIFRVHPGSLEPNIPTRRHDYLAGLAGWTLTPGKRQSAADAALWPSTDAFAREHYVVIGIAPGFYAGLTVEGLACLFVHPVTPETTRVSSALLVPAGREAEYTESPFGVREAATTLAEDRAMCERVQRAMRSRAGAPGRLVELERILVDFHAYLSDRLAPALD